MTPCVIALSVAVRFIKRKCMNGKQKYIRINAQFTCADNAMTKEKGVTR